MKKDYEKITEIANDLEKSTIIKQNIINEVSQSFLDYSMSVITSRALPDVRDGLKPVHRRILYSAYNDGLTFDKKYRKSATLVGSVMGSFHPHGDASIYDAMVRMAQDFSMRYPLIDGQGNFGSIDGDMPAAMRYTEARLSQVGQLFLKSIKEETVSFKSNYDNSKEEPTILPTSIPNLLINGSSGIAVGLATNIPPHNLNEVCNAIIATIQSEEPTPELILDHIKGPDFPTGGEVLKVSGVQDYLLTGKGSFYNRSKVEITTLNNQNCLIINEIPYLVKKSSLIKKIVHLVKPQKNDPIFPEIVNKISDIKDESNFKGIRVILTLKSDAEPNIVLNALYKHSPLQKKFATNLTVLIDNSPKNVSAFVIIQEYIKFQLELLNKKTEFNFIKTNDRLHILEGRQIVADDIINVVKILSNISEPEKVLKQEYNLSEIQLNDILQLPLRSIKKIEKEKIIQEIFKLNDLIKEYIQIINSEKLQKEIIVNNLIEIKNNFGDDRRTKMNYNNDGSFNILNFIPKEEVVITLSDKGYLIKNSLSDYTIHNRGGIGSKVISTYKDELAKIFLTCFSHDKLLLFSNHGLVYQLNVFEIPLTLKGTKGKNIVNFLSQLKKDEYIVAIINHNKNENPNSLIFATKKGLIKKTKFEFYKKINISGKIAIFLRENDELIHVIKGYDDDNVVLLLATSNGLAVKFNVNQIRYSLRKSSGVIGIKLKNNARVISLSSSNEGSYVLSIGANGIGKLSPISDFRLTNRASKGIFAQKISEKTGDLVICSIVSLSNQILLLTNTGRINRFKLSQVSIFTRRTNGIRLFKTNENENIIFAVKCSIYKNIDEVATDENIIEEDN